MGAGKGAVANLVQSIASCEVHALDPDMKKVMSIQRTHPSLRTCLSSSDSIPYPDGFFDKAYSTFAVHHFPDQPKSLRELARVLKPGGLLVLVDLAPRTLLGRINRFWENGILRYRLRFLDLQGLTLLLKWHGEFEVSEAKQVGPGYFVQAVRTKTVIWQTRQVGGRVTTSTGA